MKYAVKQVENKKIYQTLIRNAREEGNATYKIIKSGETTLRIVRGGDENRGGK